MASSKLLSVVAKAIYPWIYFFIHIENDVLKRYFEENLFIERVLMLEE